MLNLTVRGKQAEWCAWRQFVWGIGLGLLTVPAFNLDAATLSTVFAFDLHQTSTGVVQGTGSNANMLFGTTFDSSLSYGGSIYKASLDGGAPQAVYQLQSGDGYSPQAALLLGTDGNLYGTTRYAPRSGANLAVGSGTVFRVGQDGSAFTTLHTFNSTADGQFPDRALINDATYLYGVGTFGGANGAGTVFRIRKSDGLFEVLHHFAALDASGGNASGEGAFPSSSLTLVGGRLYGVTSGGGANLKKTTDSNGAVINVGTGTIYSLGTDGSAFTTHYNFSALDDTATSPSDSTVILSYNADGVQPSGNLLEVTPGVLWGLTGDGGNPSAGTVTGYGTVFKFNTLTATLTTVHAFNNDDGARPVGNLVKDRRAGGLVYGVTLSGSAGTSPTRQFGGLFRIDPNTNAFAEEYTLAFAEGNNPTGGLIQASNDDLYFTTSYGQSCTAITTSGYGSLLRYSLATNANAASYVNCTPLPTSNGGGGVMAANWMWLLAALGLMPAMRRYRFSRSRIATHRQSAIDRSRA